MKGCLEIIKKDKDSPQELTVDVNVAVAPVVCIIVPLRRCDWRREAGMPLEM